MPSVKIIRTVGDAPNISRRAAIKGFIAGAFAIIATGGIGAWAASTYEKAKAYIATRIGGLDAIDADMALRVSHANPEIATLYKEFLSPGDVLPAHTPLSHRMMHTKYGAEIPGHIAELKAVTWEEAQEATIAYMKAIKEAGAKAEAEIQEAVKGIEEGEAVAQVAAGETASTELSIDQGAA